MSEPVDNTEQPQSVFLSSYTHWPNLTRHHKNWGGAAKKAEEYINLLINGEKKKTDAKAREYSNNRCFKNFKNYWSNQIYRKRSPPSVAQLCVCLSLICSQKKSRERHSCKKWCNRIEPRNIVELH